MFDILPGVNRAASRRGVIPNPFDCYSDDIQPRSLTSVFDLCELLWATAGQFRMALQRTSRYFITKVTIDGVDAQERNRWREYLEDQLHIVDVLCSIADDFCWYGNSMSTVLHPVDRFLICPHCKYRANIRFVQDYSLDTKSMMMKAKCGKCGLTGLHKVDDQRSLDENRIYIRRWNVRLMEILHNPLTGEDKYITQLPQEIRDGVRLGHRHILESTPWEYIKAAAQDQKFAFYTDAVYHMREHVLCGLPTRGWGIPRLLPAVSDVWNLQMLRRANQAICGSYILPIQIFSPEATPGGDPAMQYDLGTYTRQLRGVIEEHHRDPSSVGVLPFPVRYTPATGEGSQIAPFELIKQSMSDTYDAMGVPIDLYQGSLNIGTAPVAARLFESQWPNLRNGMDGFLDSLASNISKAFGWTKPRLRLEKPTITDDLNRLARLSMYRQAGDVSAETAYRADNIDPEAEQTRINNENLERATRQQEFERDMSNRQKLISMIDSASEAAAGGGGGGSGSGVVGVNATPQDIVTQAQQLAQQLFSMPAGQRNSQLRQLGQQNQVLHDAVVGELGRMENQMKSQGLEQARTDAQQGGAPQ